MLPLTSGETIVDLNYLLHRHQISLVKAENAACNKARRVHDGLATGYAARITEYRDTLGASGSMVLSA